MDVLHGDVHRVRVGGTIGFEKGVGRQVLFLNGPPAFYNLALIDWEIQS